MGNLPLSPLHQKKKNQCTIIAQWKMLEIRTLLEKQKVRREEKEMERKKKVFPPLDNLTLQAGDLRIKESNHGVVGGGWVLFLHLNGGFRFCVSMFPLGQRGYVYQIYNMFTLLGLNHR